MAVSSERFISARPIQNQVVLIVSTLIAALAPLELLTNLRAQRKDRHNAVLPD